MNRSTFRYLPAVTMFWLATLAMNDQENIQQYATRLTGEILANHRGRTIVAAGHSNTVPAIVEALGARRISALTDSEYDRMFIVVIPPEGEPSVIATRYGAPTE